jgi:hypothetical protein
MKRVEGDAASSCQRVTGGAMKILQVVPRADSEESLKALLKAKLRALRARPTAFRRKSEGKLAHVKYPGWIRWDETMGGILVAEIHTKDETSEWLLLRAFVGYLERHLRDNIENITITYR